MVEHEVVAGRRTALYDEHVALGARMVEFAGWAMPMSYGGIVSEHRRVRSTAGVFDVSHMGEFIVAGPDALEVLERLTTNRVSALAEGRVQYSAMCYENGGFVDDLTLYRLPGRYMLVVNAANSAKDLEWIRENGAGKVTIEDVSDRTALVALQGPASQGVLSDITGGGLSELPYYGWIETTVAGRKALVSRTGYTGEDGFEIYHEPKDAPAVWAALLESGRSVDIEPIGLGARDTLRLEMGYSLYGREMDANRTPVEAGLLWITKLDKGDFIGRDAIARVLEQGPAGRIVGFELLDRGVPRHGQKVYRGDNEAGCVTSGTFSPSLERGIGLAFADSGLNGDLSVEIRESRVPARVAELPFYRGGSVRRRRAAG